MNDIIEREKKSADRKKAAFDKWLNEPMVRMGISMIPAGEKQEALKMLLQSAFDAGHGAGSGDIAGMMLEAMFKDRQERKP